MWRIRAAAEPAARIRHIASGLENTREKPCCSVLSRREEHWRSSCSAASRMRNPPISSSAFSVSLCAPAQRVVKRIPEEIFGQVDREGRSKSRAPHRSELRHGRRACRMDQSCEPVHAPCQDDHRPDLLGLQVLRGGGDRPWNLWIGAAASSRQGSSTGLRR